MNRVTVPWVRTRLRAAPGAAWALAVLVTLTACLAAAFPRALDRYADAGLERALTQARPDRTSVLVVAPQPDLALSAQERAEQMRPEQLGGRYGKVLAAVEGAPLPVDRAQSAYGVRTTDGLPVPEPWLPQPSGLPARFHLAAQEGLGDHARIGSGRLPRVTGGQVTASTGALEAAVTEETARALRIEVGSVLHVPGVERAPLTVRVTGVLAPRAPRGAYWSTQPVLREPSLMTVPGSAGADREQYWLGTLLLAPEAGPALLATAGTPVRYWQAAPDTDVLHAHDLDGLTSAVAGLESGPGLREVRAGADPAADVATDLDEVFASFGELRSGIGPLLSVAAVGAGTVAGVVLLMAGGLAADRRRAELALLRARGASLRGLAGRLLAETAVVALPAGVLGLAAALLALPGGRLLPAVGAAGAVTAVACAALPVRAAFAHRAVRVHGGRRDVASARPSRRRTVAELTAVALALGAVETLRRSGASGDAGDLVSAAPVLVGVIAALLMVRLYPLPLRGLARPAGRLRGAVGHLALARAGRTPVSAVLPLLALLTALTTAAFGGSVLAGVADARDQAAVRTVGADARIQGTDMPLPDGVSDRARRASGVREVAEVGLTDQARAGDGRQNVPLAGVDPAAYARLAAGTGLGAFDAGTLERPGSGAGQPLRALASPAVAERFGTGPFSLRTSDGTSVTVRIVLVRASTPAVSGDDFLVVDRAGLSAEAARPTLLLLTGDHLDAGALRRAAGDTGSVLLRSAERGRYVDSPLQSGAERVYAVAVVAGAGYAVLALLLSLLRAAPERTALLARLRTMGLTRAQGRRLLVLESLPQAVLAAAGGALTGWATVRLLAPGIDLTTIALAAASAPVDRAGLRTDPWSLALPAVAVLVVAVGVAGVQAWWSGRRGSVTELRAGDPR